MNIAAWLRTVLPQALFNMGPQKLMWWQWLAIPVLAIIALAIARLLAALTRGWLHRWFKRTTITWDDRLLARVGGAITMLWAIAAFRIMLPWLDLAPDSPLPIQMNRLLAAGVVVTTFWALWRSVDVLTETMLSRPWADRTSARSLVAVTGNFTKAAVAVIGVLTTIAAFGYPVATALAGLGIGGIALAFGAQKTVENLFGSVALAADQPCRVGDFVKVEDISGEVESIGTRSTRIRTLDRTLVTIPNGRLADMRIETFAVRDRIRFTANIGLAHATTEAQMRRVLAAMEEVLRSHPNTWPESIVAKLAGFSTSGLDIEVMCWCRTADYNVFRDYRQDILFGFMRVVEESGTVLAAPLTTTPRPATTAMPPSL